MHEGGLDVLNVGLGDLTLRWNKEDPADVKKAQDTIEDLMRKGYAVMVQLEDGSYQRIKEFDRSADAYVIVQAEEQPATVSKATRSPRKVREVRKPRRATKATAIARSAGG